MSMEAMLSQEEISFRDEFKIFLEGLDLSFILRMDKEDEKEFPKDFVRPLERIIIWASPCQRM
jgi:hypothetical protein